MIPTPKQKLQVFESLDKNFGTSIDEIAEKTKLDKTLVENIIVIFAQSEIISFRQKDDRLEILKNWNP